MFERDTLKKVPSRSQSDADWTRYKQQKKTMLIILSREQKQVTVETSLEITLEILNIWKGMNAML